MEEKGNTICPLCKSGNATGYMRKNGIALVKCSDCGFVYIPPEYYGSAEKVNEQYAENKTSPSEYFSSTRYYDIKYANQILSEAEKYMCPGTLLDIGCSVGNFMIAARERGWKPAGLEPNPVAAGLARKEGFEVFNEYFNEEFTEKYGEKYDAIYMGGVIEHIVNPLKFCKLSHGIISPDGILMITTCNIRSFLGKKYQVKPEEHLVYFDMDTARNLLEKSGFEVLFVIRNSRFRDLASIDKSTTEINMLENIIVKITKFFHLSKVISVLLSLIARDEIFIAGRKK